MKLSRRSTFAVLAGGTLSGGALAMGFGIEHIALSDQDLVRSVLEKHLGRFPMENDEIAAFHADFLDRNHWRFPPEKLAIIYGAAERINMSDSLIDLLPGDRGKILEQFERHLVGAFLSQTDFTYRFDISQPVRFLGTGACVNPFAEFV